MRHVDLYYEDGANPPESILQAFLQVLPLAAPSPCLAPSCAPFLLVYLKGCGDTR